MKRNWLLYLFFLLIWGNGFPTLGQRRVSSVKSASQQAVGINENRARLDSIRRAGRIAKIDDGQGNFILVDTVTGKEVQDTTSALASSVPKMIQPLLFSTTVGLDIWDPVMRLFGQHYGVAELSAEVNLHNRYVPVIEVGLGKTNYRPDRDGNYTFHVPITPYFRIGCNYNFLYNSNPDYMAYAGLRLGFSHFKWEVNDVTLSGNYWGPSPEMNFPGQTATVTYLQVLFGIRVKIAGPVSLGWAFRFKTRLHETKSSMGYPWYIPGYGSREGHIAGSFSIFYTFQLGPNLLPPPGPSKH